MTTDADLMIEAEDVQTAAAGQDEVRLESFRPRDSQVTAERILRIQGYKSPDSVRVAIRRAAQAMATKALELCDAQVAFKKVYVVSIDNEGISLAGDARLFSPAFAYRLNDCEEVVPFVLSCGLALSHTIIDLAEAGDLLEAVLLESAGWLCIEDVTRQFKESLKSEAAHRYRRITSRMGPGYTYQVGGREVSWPLEDHPHLFGLLSGRTLPVTLMPSCAMNPKLSRSGLYGIAPLHHPQAGRPESNCS